MYHKSRKHVKLEWATRLASGGREMDVCPGGEKEWKGNEKPQGWWW